MLETRTGSCGVSAEPNPDHGKCTPTPATVERRTGPTPNTVRAADRSRALTEARLRGGIAPRTDLLQAQQILETARADLAQQRALRAQDANLLQLLVGAPIDPSLLPNSLDQAAPTIANLPAGLDSRILVGAHLAE